MSIPDQTPDLMSDPVEIAPNTWWVGKRAPGEIFYANPILRSFPAKNAADERGSIEFVINPGLSKEFPQVRAKIEEVIEDVGKTSVVFVTHQDPDVASSVGLILGHHAPKAHVVCSGDTWELVQHYNIPADRFVPVEEYSSGLEFPNGERLHPVPSPFCHFVGAVMLYDPQTRVLFSGDLFGSLTNKDARGLWADESDWVGMRAFHQIYMPTNQALRVAFAAIRALEPTPLAVVPHHGRLLRGEWVHEYIRRLEELPVGLDIVGNRAADHDAWNSALERVTAKAQTLLGDRVIADLADDPELSGLVKIDGGRLTITSISMGQPVLETVVRLLTHSNPLSVANQVRYEAMTACMDLQLPTPNIELEEGSDVAAELTDAQAFMKIREDDE